MRDIFSVLSKEELTAFSLRALYAEYGYAQYRMSKFEEYDLYGRNKDFLVSENVIAFSDTDGRLLALKPDVTLSIIKNYKESEGDIKVYYNENVYRLSKGTHTFKEIMQAGLERMGEVGDRAIAEVLLLAAKSLDLISENNLLEISHLDVVKGVLSACELSESAKREIVKRLGEKNVRGILETATAENLSDEKKYLLTKLSSEYGKIEQVLPELETFKVNAESARAVEQFVAILSALRTQGVGEKLCVDFSVVNDMKYYNGLAFKGFIEGIPVGVLSGGQYDGMMQKMRKNARAIGFAVYLDELSRLPRERGGKK